jgi:hypothetical protein
MSTFARLAVICAMVPVITAHAASGSVPGDSLRVEVDGRDADVLRLVDASTQAVIARDRIPGGHVRDSVVAPDGSVAAVRYGAADDGDCLVVYAIDWSIDSATGAKLGSARRALEYRPRDGRVDVSLRTVPNGTVVLVQTGRHPPLWHKIFFHERTGDRWLEWPRALAPADPTQGMPTGVGGTDTGAAYNAWLRPLASPGR